MDTDHTPSQCPIEVIGLTMAYGSRVIQHDVNFKVQKGATFVIMGGSGCGKSTLLRHLIGLQRPATGKVLRNGFDIWQCSPKEQDIIRQTSGVMYQSGGLWSAMTLAENVAFPLQEYTALSEREIKEICHLKLALVGLAGFEDFYPSELSGGMQKRAGLARAMALDPDVLFFDEPSAGLDPVSARRLDDLIVELRERLGTTIVVVTHELASIFTIATDSIYLDNRSLTLTAHGHPAKILQETDDESIITFLTRGEGRSGNPQSR
ncbi:MAG: ATP-binding cassette domain-containing protein [Victivallales bacterium]|nr:ATP-binding cassette domain-containing protein [Victivallales bacterium]